MWLEWLQYTWVNRKKLIAHKITCPRQWVQFTRACKLVPKLYHYALTYSKTKREEIHACFQFKATSIKFKPNTGPVEWNIQIHSIGFTHSTFTSLTHLTIFHKMLKPVQYNCFFIFSQSPQQLLNFSFPHKLQKIHCSWQICQPYLNLSHFNNFFQRKISDHTEKYLTTLSILFHTLIFLHWFHFLI